MASDIVSNLHLDRDFKTNKLIVAQEINGCDSGFIISCVLGHCIKNKKPVLLILAHNSLSHFQNVGLKMNYNLQKSIDTSLIDVYNVGHESVNSLMSGERISLQQLWLNTESKINFIKEKYGEVNVILDGVSHLFDLQYSLSDVNNFIRYLRDSVRSVENSFTLCHCNIASVEDVTHVMANLLAHQADTVAEVASLASGWSGDVSGHLTIRHPGLKFEDEHSFTMDLKPSRFLFKLFDRGVKLFAPGTV